jgi:hypothetical protein
MDAELDAEMEGAFWQGVVEHAYAVPSERRLEEMTRALLDRLGSPNPVLRDRYAYPILEHWLHADVYSEAAVRGMMAELAANLMHGLGEREADSVFLRTFSVLLLAEIVHYDNARHFLDRDEVRQLLELALVYLEAERDLRGWVPEKGWAHSVAHTADLLFVLAGSRYLDAPDLRRLLDGVAEKVAVGGAFYVCGEDERLVRAVVAVAERGLLAVDDLAAWVQQLGQPLSNPNWMQDATLEPELDVHHNIKLLMQSLYVHLTWEEEPPAGAAALVPAMRDALHMLAW